jgi:hypothetical protein
VGKGNKLFGMHIGKIVYNAIKAAGDVLPVTLVSVTEGIWNPAAPLAGTNPTSVSRPCKGFSNDPNLMRAGHGNIPDDILSTMETEIFIFNATLPEGVEPKPSDRIVFLAKTWHVKNVKTDPAKALFVCVCRGGA